MSRAETYRRRRCSTSPSTENFVPLRTPCRRVNVHACHVPAPPERQNTPRLLFKTHPDLLKITADRLKTIHHRLKMAHARP